MSGFYFEHAQDDINPHISRMLDGTFSHDAVAMKTNKTHGN